MASRRCSLLSLIILLVGLGAPAALGAQERLVPQSNDQVLLSFAPVVKKASPAVVNVFSKRTIEARGNQSPLFSDPLFKRFFGDSFGGGNRRRVERSLGSGVIVDAKGLIVTNHHVIAGATEIRVVLSDKREFDAIIVISDKRTDLALLSIDPGAADLPTLTFKNSDDVEVGDIVLALGNPFGVGQTVTSGIVSALGRTQVDVTDFSSFIQTDAAINPGNSGGALVTLDGKLIGINTAIFSRSGGSIGIGFAVPSNMVRTVVYAAETGRLVRAWVGLTGQSLTADLAEGLGIERPGGVVVNKVYPEGPAEAAGLAPGDIILSFGGQDVSDLEALRFRVATAPLGDVGELEVSRDGSVFQARLPLQAPPEVPPRNPRLLKGPHPLAGALIASLSPALSEELDLPGSWAGVVIVDVKPGSPARRLRFRPGDLIHAVNGRKFSNSGALAAWLKGAEAVDGWRITFQRGEKVHNVDFR